MARINQLVNGISRLIKSLNQLIHSITLIFDGILLRINGWGPGRGPGAAARGGRGWGCTPQPDPPTLDYPQISKDFPIMCFSYLGCLRKLKKN